MNKFYKNMLVAALATFAFGLSVNLGAMEVPAAAAAAASDAAPNVVAPEEVKVIIEEAKDVKNAAKEAVKAEDEVGQQFVLGQLVKEEVGPNRKSVRQERAKELQQKQLARRGVQNEKKSWKEKIALLKPYAHIVKGKAQDAAVLIKDKMVTFTRDEFKAIKTLVQQAWRSQGEQRKEYRDQLIKKIGMNGLKLFAPWLAYNIAPWLVFNIGLDQLALAVASGASSLLWYPAVASLGMVGLIKAEELAETGYTFAGQKIKAKLAAKGINLEEELK